MRMGFGILSLLVVIGIMMILFKTYEAPQIEQGQKAQEAAQQISGRDKNGAPAMNSYQAESYDVGSKFKGIKITDVTAGGAMATYYGLKTGDIVMAIGGNDVDILGGSYGAAKGMLDQAYQTGTPILVQRDKSQISLPVGGGKSPLDSLNIPTH